MLFNSTARVAAGAEALKPLNVAAIEATNAQNVSACNEKVNSILKQAK